MPPTHCLRGIAQNVVAAELITVRNRNPGGNSAALTDRSTFGNANVHCHGNPNSNAVDSALLLGFAGVRAVTTRPLRATIPNSGRRCACADCDNVRWWLRGKRFVDGRIVWGGRAHHRAGKHPEKSSRNRWHRFAACRRLYV